MKKIAPNVFIEEKYDSVHLGMIQTDEGLMLVDAPLRVEDTRQWLQDLHDYGKPAYLALLDHHPERVLGSRILDLPRIAHDQTRLVMAEWPDTFKGSTHPIGGESDQLKRITGISRTVPEVTFSKTMIIHLGKTEFHFRHSPGPTAGAMWMLVPEAQAVFIGDAVTVKMPPFIGSALLDRWIETLDALRDPFFDEYKIISSRDGLIEREDINSMARFLRKIGPRLEKLAGLEDGVEKAGALAGKLAADFQVPPSKQEQGLTRLQIGLQDLYSAQFQAA